MIPKIMALYLPQFHEVEENNKWYGQGFTDWVAVKNAKPLFSGHMQPRRPLNNDYYDLNNVETIKKQAELAKKYGIDGFCFYHYWFDSNTRLLQKPAELLLQHKEIDVTFCFSWANESWKRTWSNIGKGNVWCELYDKDKQEQSGSGRGLLVKQRYGRAEEWKKHIEYLLPFFQDKRYLRIDGKPVLLIYQPCDILCIRSMLEIWKEKLKENDIDGVYLVGGSYGKAYSGDMDVSYDHEPGEAFIRCREEKEYIQSAEGIEFFDYDVMWKYILQGVRPGVLSCAVTDFDASPRKGYKSCIIHGSTPEKFEQYFKVLLKKNIRVKNELILINAWNEWGESMYLEPCEDNGFKYLKAVKGAVDSVNNNPKQTAEYFGETEGKALSGRTSKTGPGQRTTVSQVTILDQWLEAYRFGLRVEDFFKKYKYRTIAIYGMGILGRHLLEELAGSEVKILYYIDRSVALGDTVIRKVSVNDELPEADAIVVTVLTEFEEIYEILKEKSDAAIIHIGEIFEDL